MPTYKYECKKCGHNFEVFQSMSDEPLTQCVKCGKEVRRLILGGAGIIFKGSGFYATDANKGKKAGGETKTEQTPAPAAQNSAGNESKDSAASKDAGSSKSAVADKARTPTQTA
jgi:putative FmdB family regulatory protein